MTGVNEDFLGARGKVESECGRANVGIEKIWSVKTREREKRGEVLGDWGMLNNGGGILPDAQRALPKRAVLCCAAVRCLLG